MAAQSSAQVWRIPGRLVLNPSNLASAYPHGGTALGYSAKQLLQWNQIVKTVRAREWVQTIEQHERMLEPVFKFMMLQADTDLFSRLFKSTSSGTGYFRVDSGSYGPARGNLPAVEELVLSPTNTAAKGLVFRRPLVTFEPLSSTPFSAKKVASVALLVTPTPTATGPGWEWVELVGAST